MITQQAIHLVIPGVPIAQPRQRAALVAGQIRNYLPGKHPVNTYKATVRALWAQLCSDEPPRTGAVSLQVAFCLKRPQNETRKTRPNPRLRHHRKPDVDNLSKALIDALTGLAWVDDAQIAELHVLKWIAAGPPNVEAPHTELWVDTFEETDA